MAKLILTLKGATLEEFPITKSSMTIGRVTTNDIVIDNLAVSRHHARIVLEDDGYLVEDLGSGNGLFVNEQPVVKATLRDRDEILVGKHALIFVDEKKSSSAMHDDRAADLAEATIILNPKAQIEMAQRIGDQAGLKTERHSLEGHLVLLSRNATMERVALIKQTTVGGKHQKADVPLKGAFVGQNAFVISKNPDGFFIKHAEGKRMTRVNGEVVREQRALQDGDLITIGATKMQFCSKSVS